MAHLRLASIPVEHLIAEMAAFPLASEAALDLGPAALDPLIASRQRDGNQADRSARVTAQLWRAAERKLATSCPSVSLDELVAVRDRLWFRRRLTDQHQPVALGAYLRSIASSRLRARGATAVPCLQEDATSDDLRAVEVDGPRSREAWRWLTFALPPDLLLAALPGIPMPSKVETLSPQMNRALEQHGFAESHLHFGAGLDFGLLWIATMCRVGESSVKASSFRSAGAELNEGRDFAHWLVRAAITRYVLASFLVRYDPTSEECRDLRRYLKHVAMKEVAGRLGMFAAVLLNHALGQLAAGQLNRTDISLPEYQVFYARLAGARSRDMPEGPGGVDLTSPRNRCWQMDLACQADPLSRIWAVSDRHQPTAEMRFTAAGLDYLDSDSVDDPDFSRLFWQVIRVRNLLYRHIIQRPMTPGLPWFIRTYGRISPARGSLATALKMESSAISCGYGRGLRTLEVRTSPWDNAGEMLRQVDDANVHFHGLNRPSQHGVEAAPEFGYIFHLARLRDGGNEDGMPNAFWSQTHADPATEPLRDRPVVNPTGFRYASFFQETRRDVLALGRMLLNFPRSLSVVRGIDLCTDELAIPTWVMVPLFRYLRDVSIHVSHWLYTHCGAEVPPLRTTVHAGEDFVHLMGGLRRIDDSIRRLELREGDRIGHAIALGIDARQWAMSAGRIAVFREERLFDLVWEWSCYARRRVPTDVERRAFVEREIARLTQLVFGRSIPPFDFETLVDLLHREDSLAWAGFPDGRPPQSPSGASGSLAASHRKAKRWLRLYLRDPRIFRFGRQIEWVDPAGECEALESLQHHLRLTIGRMGLAVEVNPSSNLLIANLGDLSGHPLWRLDPPIEDPNIPPVPVCIGSDDPITFATNLRNEHMLIHDALIMAGCTEPQASAWLKRARETGLAMRFTIPQPAQVKVSTPCGPVDDRSIRLPI